jgi:DNA-binding transcriptional ArsR family regulator
MDVDTSSDSAAGVAAAIGEPARARMLFSLMDGHARTSTELAVVAGVSASTASVHLRRLQAESLLNLRTQGKHHYYCLASSEVATVLEGLSGLAGGARPGCVVKTPAGLRAARTCYDHIAGALGVALHERFGALQWWSTAPRAYELTAKGVQGFEALGIDVAAARAARRRFAYGCLDWSERRDHLGGALGAAVLELMLKRRWVRKQLDSRALSITGQGRRELLRHLNLHL